MSEAGSDDPGGVAQAARWAEAYLERVATLPVAPDLAPGRVGEQLPSSAPDQGESVSEILEDLDRILVPASSHWNHPGFLAYFNSSSSSASIAGALAAAALNPNAMSWRGSPAATELEERMVAWLCDLLGLPRRWGMLTPGGSESTLLALLGARTRAFPRVREEGIPPDAHPTLYWTVEAHASARKAAVVLGLGESSVRIVPTDDDLRMDPEALDAMLREDLEEGAAPVAVVATLGTTGTAILDPVDRIAEVCRKLGVWLHVDAAHGGGAAVVEEVREAFAGWEGADSIVINPHKWLFVPIGCSLLLVEEPGILRRTMSLAPDYLRSDTEDLDFKDYGIELGRPARALPLWFALRWMGREGYRARVLEHLELADRFASWVDGHPRLERVAPVDLSTVAFRVRPPSGSDPDAPSEHLLARLNRRGRVFLSSTRVRGLLTLRAVFSGLRVTDRLRITLQNEISEILEET